MNFFKNLFTRPMETDFISLLEKGALIIDVRTPGEFSSGNIKGSLNIPLDQVHGAMALIKKKNLPVITCCRSGSRSGIAKNIFQAAGIECYNGGAWEQLNKQLKAA